jgi:hypothetical protein
MVLFSVKNSMIHSFCSTPYHIAIVEFEASVATGQTATAVAAASTAEHSQ